MNRAQTFFTSVGLAVLLLFGLTVPAHAITTLTSTFLRAASGHFIECAIVNVGPAPITVMIQLIDSGGAVLDDDSMPVFPGATRFLLSPFSPVGGHCKFTGNFNRGFVRASAQVVGSNLATLVVVPAQAVGE